MRLLAVLLVLLTPFFPRRGPDSPDGTSVSVMHAMMEIEIGRHTPWSTMHSFMLGAAATPKRRGGNKRKPKRPNVEVLHNKAGIGKFHNMVLCRSEWGQDNLFGR